MAVTLAVEVRKEPNGTITRRLLFTGKDFAEVIAGWKATGSQGTIDGTLENLQIFDGTEEHNRKSTIPETTR